MLRTQIIASVALLLLVCTHAEEEAWKSVSKANLATLFKMTKDPKVGRKFHDGNLLLNGDKDQSVGGCLLDQAINVRDKRTIQFYPDEIKVMMAACCMGPKADHGQCIKDVSPAFEAIVEAEAIVGKPEGTVEALEALSTKALAHMMKAFIPRLNGAHLSTQADMDLLILEKACPVMSKGMDACTPASVFKGVAADPYDFDDDDDDL